MRSRRAAKSKSKLLLIAAWLYLTLIAAWQYADMVSLYGWPLRLLNYAAFWLGLLVLPVLVWGLLKRRWWLGVTSGVLSIIVLWPYVPLFLPRTVPIPLPQSNISIMTYSVMGRNGDIHAITDLIRRHPADIVVLQELQESYAAVPTRAILEHDLATLYGGQPIQVLMSTLGTILSRYPLRLAAPLKGHQANLQVEQVWVDIPNRQLQVWNAHLTKPTVNFAQHSAQIQALSDAVESSTSIPIIIAGDFNMPERSEGYRQLTQDLHDAHAEAGWGLGFTFPTPARNTGLLGPFVRIDHIFYSPPLCAIKAQVLNESGGSDHFPIWAELGWCSPIE